MSAAAGYSGGHAGMSSYATGSAARRPKSAFAMTLDEERRRSLSSFAVPPSQKGRASATTNNRFSTPQRQQLYRVSFAENGSASSSPANKREKQTLDHRPRGNIPSPSRLNTSNSCQSGATPPASAGYLSQVSEEEEEEDRQAKLLAKLQQTVLEVSRCAVDEKKRFLDQQRHLEEYKRLFNEQEEIIDSLRVACQRAQEEVEALTAARRLDGRRSVTTSARSPELSWVRTPLDGLNTSINTSATSATTGNSGGGRVTAGAVDAYILNAFCHCAKGLSDRTAAMNPLSEVSPLVAAVLRFLASHVLQDMAGHRDARTSVFISPPEDPLVNGATPSHPSLAQSTTGGFPSSSSTAARREERGGGAAAPFQNATSLDPTTLPSPPMPKKTPLPTAQPHRIEAISHPPESTAAPADITQGYLPKSRQLQRQIMDGNRDPSISSSVYEDATSILADIRQRYGL